MDLSHKFILVSFAFLLLNYELRAQNDGWQTGSLIITLVSNDTVWIGSDSRTAALTEKGYTVNKNGMCKIHCTNNIIYAMAGHVRYADNSFNFLHIMEKAIAQTGNFDSAMQRFQENTKKEIISILRKFSPSSIQTLIKKNNGAFLSVMAVSFSNGEKKIKEMRFSIQPEGNNQWKVNYTDYDFHDTGSLRFLGHASNAVKYINENRFYFGDGKNIPQKLVELIQLESDKGTVTVGLPADVVSIYNNGFLKPVSSGLCE